MNCRGVALVTGLVLLAAVALLAVTAAGSMTLLQHQAANFAEKNRARENAALAESYAIAWLFSRADTERQPGCASDCLLPAGILTDDEVPEQPEFASMAWWRQYGTAAGRHPLTDEEAGYSAIDSTESLWTIEEIHYQALQDGDIGGAYHGVAYYRVFSRGSGGHPGSVVVSEAIVARPWGGGTEPGDFPPAESLSDFCRQFPQGMACGIQSWRERR